MTSLLVSEKGRNLNLVSDEVIKKVRVFEKQGWKSLGNQSVKLIPREIGVIYVISQTMIKE